MTLADLPRADELRALAGWNQTLTDWERLLSLEPHGCFLAEWEDQAVGTATTTSYAPELAWIGMVLVHPSFRRRGIARALVRRCLEHLNLRGIRCVKLDASPEGKPLYEQLGFTLEGSLTRWQGEIGTGRQLPSKEPVRLLSGSDWRWVPALDLGIFGAPRKRLIERLAEQSHRTLVLESGGGLAGYGMIRAGALADYLGPVVALSAGGGQALLSALLSAASEKRLFWDIPDKNVAAADMAKRLGFRAQRSLTRMFLGENRSLGVPRQQFAIADPATG